MTALSEAALEPAETRDALCREEDPELFFERESRGDWRGRHRLTLAAKAICDQCPIRRRCLEVALINREPYGIFGGLTATERRRLTRLEAAA